MQQEIAEIATEIIYYAGNARKLVSDAWDYADKEDFEHALSALTEAEKELDKAHSAQTDIIQNEAQGETTPMSLLMVHTQATLMVAASEVIQTRRVLRILQKR